MGFVLPYLNIIANNIKIGQNNIIATWQFLLLIDSRIKKWLFLRPCLKCENGKSAEILNFLSKSFKNIFNGQNTAANLLFSCLVILINFKPEFLC